MEEPGFQPIITLYDAVTDSPVFRSSVYRYDQQVEHLEHWLNSLSRHLKSYTEKLNKLNAETTILCQKALPEGIDETLMDPNFTGAIMKGFADALNTSLSFKAKLISNLEECLVTPLQQFVKTNLRDFKNFRKQHEKALEKYESQLAKYSALSKSKEPSAVREEAFRLHEARKEYVRMSGQHVLRILNFRSALEHCLVERFSAAAVAHKDFYKDIQVWANLDAALSYWKQWLVDDKFTCSYQLHRQQVARKKLEDEFIRLTEPYHDIERYVVPLQTVRSGNSMANSKWGYLFVRVSRHSWARKWFFVHAGYFGVCQVESSGKQKSSITVETKVRLSDCQVNAVVDTDRRFCFEVIQPKQQASFTLQAETEESKQEWLRVFMTNAKDEVPSSPMSLTKSSGTIRSKSNATTAISSPTATSVHSNDSTSSLNNVSTLGSPKSYSATSGINKSALSLSRYDSEQGSSIVMVSTTPDTEATLENSSSLTPLLVWEAAKGASSSTATKQLPSGSWGIPWSLVPTMMNLTQDFNMLNTNATKAPASSALPQIVWPAKPASVDIPDVDITGYSAKMNSQNRELRRLFGGVEPTEVVLDVFMGCLRREPTSTQFDTETAKSSLNSASADSYEKELARQLTTTGLKPPSDYGYAYAGRGYITQTTFWFYSCVLMTCINSVAIRLKDIDQVQIVKDASLAQLVNETALAMNSDMVIAITLLPNARSNIAQPLVLGTIVDDIETTAEKLRFAVNNAKSEEPMQTRNIFNKLQNIAKNAATHKSVMLDLPLSFSGALNHLSNNTEQLNTGTIMSVSPLRSGNRPHAATIGSDSRVVTKSILTNGSNNAKTRQRGESEPIKPFVAQVAAQIKPVVKTKPKVAKPPRPDPDMPPAHIKCPDQPVDCNCDDHLERQDAQINLPISAKRCYELIFSDELTAPPTDGGVWAGKTAAIEGHDLSVTKWGMADGKMQRILKYWMPVSNPIVRMKEAEVVETQILVNKEDYIRYTVQISTKTAALPYADAFIPSVRYCITWVSKSECQLTCYLGVRWVKSVLVKAIVTRAALKGMADSVGVFIPIIQDAAQGIKSTVDQARQETIEYNKSLLSSSSKQDLASSSQSVNAMEVLEEAGEEQKEYELQITPIVENVQVNREYQRSPQILNMPVNVPAVAVVTEKPVPLTASASPSPSTSLSPVNATAASSTSSKSSARVSAEKSVTAKPAKAGGQPTRSISQKPSSGTAQAKAKPWHSYATDYMPIGLKAGTLVAVFCFAIYLTSLWLRSGNQIADKADALIGSNNTWVDSSNERPIVIRKKSSANTRSVYLRDLEEGVLKNSIKPPYANSLSYQVFLQNKQHNATADVTSEHHHRDWYAVDHYRLAVELDMSRERVGILRHDMLTIFRVLNKLDSELVENEFSNWLLDTRLKCKYYPPLPEEDPRAEKAVALCQDVRDQIEKIF